MAIRVLIFDNNTHVLDARCARANGYRLKKCVSTKLVERIDEVQQVGAPKSPTIARMIIGNLQRTQPTGYGLTKSEQDVLQALS